MFAGCVTHKLDISILFDKTISKCQNLAIVFFTYVTSNDCLMKGCHCDILNHVAHKLYSPSWKMWLCDRVIQCITSQSPHIYVVAAFFQSCLFFDAQITNFSAKCKKYIRIVRMMNNMPSDLPTVQHRGKKSGIWPLPSCPDDIRACSYWAGHGQVPAHTPSHPITRRVQLPIMMLHPIL